MGPGVRLTTQSHIIPRIRMSGTLPVLPHTPSWLASGHLYLKSSNYTRRPHISLIYFGDQSSWLPMCRLAVMRTFCLALLNTV